MNLIERFLFCVLKTSFRTLLSNSPEVSLPFWRTIPWQFLDFLYFGRIDSLTTSYLCWRIGTFHLTVTPLSLLLLFSSTVRSVNFQRNSVYVIGGGSLDSVHEKVPRFLEIELVGRFIHSHVLRQVVKWDLQSDLSLVKWGVITSLFCTLKDKTKQKISCFLLVSVFGL